MISCICTTYRRHHCLRRIISMWLDQNYKDKELIIFNTDVDYPVVLDDTLVNENIIVINNNTDYITGNDYNNTGSIRRDAVTHANGEYFMLWDDDDLYLPFNLTQAVDKIRSSNKKAWKPEKSFYMSNDNLELCINNMEASVIVEMAQIKKYGFKEHAGEESLQWYYRLISNNEIKISKNNYVPSYCFNWSDPPEIGGHKQSSSTIEQENNFELHKQNVKDIVDVKLKPLETKDYYGKINMLNDYIKTNLDEKHHKLIYDYINRI